MADPDFSEFAQVGSDIMQLGLKLKDLREQRDEINASITSVEKELAPLMQKHAQMLASVTGQILSAPRPTTPSAFSPATSAATVPPVISERQAELLLQKKKIVNFLKTSASPGMSPLDIAERLQVPPELVREAMRESCELTGVSIS